MKRTITFLFVLILIIVFSTVYAQFTPEEIAQRQEIEEFLLTAEIVRAKDIGEGITKPKRLYLKRRQGRVFRKHRRLAVRNSSLQTRQAFKPQYDSSYCRERI
jgi:hypothetical protein